MPYLNKEKNHAKETMIVMRVMSLQFAVFLSARFVYVFGSFTFPRPFYIYIYRLSIQT